MAVVNVVGSVLHFILKVVLLPVQAILTLLELSISFIGGLVLFLTKAFGVLLIVAAIFDWITKTYSSKEIMETFVTGLCVAIIPEALVAWGVAGIEILKDFLYDL